MRDRDNDAAGRHYLEGEADIVIRSVLDDSALGEEWVERAETLLSDEIQVESQTRGKQASVGYSRDGDPAYSISFVKINGL